MERNRFFILMGVVLLVAALSWGVGQVGAQMTVLEQTPQKLVIQDAAGRIHTVMRMHSITPEQRKAAAERAKAAAQQKQSAPSSQGEVAK